MTKNIPKYVSELKRLLTYEQKRQIRSGIYGHTQRALAYNSNRIEGSTLTKDHTASLFETGTIYAESDVIYRAKDIEEMTGHFRMCNYAILHFKLYCHKTYLTQ